MVAGRQWQVTARRHTQCENLNENNMSVPKNIKDFPSFAIVNLLRCPVEDQISVVSKLLKHLDREQRAKALSMSGVVESDDLVSRKELIEQFSKTDEYYKSEGRYQYSDGLNKARYLIARHGREESF